jgi:hypothetical protein
MTTRLVDSKPCSARGSNAPPAEDPWADAAKYMRAQVVRRPYLALLTAGAVGSVLATGLPLRLIARLVRPGIRLACATALAAATQVARDPPTAA